MKFDFADFVDIPKLSLYIDQVEHEMRTVLASSNPSIQQAINRLLAVQGKRLRPSLVLAVAASQSKTIDEKVIHGCVAIELIHLGSLVHDDIIDESESRWNIPTINTQEGINTAILIGDYLLAKACAVAAQVSSEAAELIANTTTILCEGQALELTDAFALDRSEAALLETIREKTAALLAAACQMGGLCTGMSAAQIATLGRYGEEFGMAFQLVDDILDFVADPKKFGKVVGNDVREGVYTLPLLLALKGPEGEILKHWFSQADRMQDELTVIVARSGGFKETMRRIQVHNEIAAKSLEIFNNSSTVVSDLQKLPTAYTQWAVQYLVAPVFQNDI
jgi:geranylgeranyl pyrophosphate synthase